MFGKPSASDLQLAVQDGTICVVQEHLNRGINPNIRDRKVHQGMPLLAAASMNGRTEVMRLLMKHGAKVDRTDFHGRTPLSWAAEHGQIDAVKLLIKHGANVNAEDTVKSGILLLVGR